MKSIRRRITTWLLAGLTALWIAGGTAIYLSSRSAMIAGIDTRNQGLSRQVRALSRGTGGGGPGRWQHEDEAPRTEPLLEPRQGEKFQVGQPEFGLAGMASTPWG